MAFVGYARVSTNGQDLAGQEAELAAAGCAKVFKEKASGAKTDRPELAKLMRRLEPDDVLVVTRLDRLARSTRDLLNLLAQVSEQGAGFKSLKDSLGRHHKRPRKAHADHSGRLSRVRKRADSCPHWRRQEAGKGPWRKVWTATEALAPPTAGSPTAALGRRFVRRSRTNLWRRPHDHRTPAA